MTEPGSAAPSWDGETVRQVVRDTNYVTWRRQGGWNPLVVTRAKDSTFWDDKGRAYLDFSSQLMATNLGHGNAAVVEAIAAQARTLAYAGPSFATEARARLSSALLDVLPHGLNRFFFSTSGTEANEAALKIARVATGRTKVLSRHRSYHGATAASISVTGDPRRRPVDGLQTVPGTVFAPDCYCYRCPFGLTYPSCHVECAEYVDRQLEREGNVAAMILEPVVGTNGVIVPVPEYLPRVREITRQHGVLLIADEVMTGWGRVGEWFAVDHWKVEPDILTTAKGITGALVPLGLTATTSALHETFRDRYFPHGHTYEAHPLTLAPAVAAIGEYRRLDLLAKSRRDGEYLLERLREIQGRHPSVGEVRGLGLFAAVELVRDRTTRAPFNTEEDKLAGRPLVAEAVAAAMMKEGVFCVAWVSHLVIAPPLIVTREELDHGLEVLDRALAVADREVRGGPSA
ncbi:MAG TPA: aminotransferase class III-fold pyridoxal phosphate-dependent enzyme [Thermoplasmata archaeon]|nr:aminotransferase class III-fold pyridoxal phosphate-dependent enzyme [Thermoplasmata archaeon]